MIRNYMLNTEGVSDRTLPEVINNLVHIESPLDKN